MVSKRCYLLRDRPHKLPNTVDCCCCCCCCVGIAGGSDDGPLRRCICSRGLGVARACGSGTFSGGGGGGGTGEGRCCCLGAVGRGFSSGIGILLRCTERLEGGVYALRGGSSSLMRCSPVGFDSYTTYWCRSSDSTPALTSAIRMSEAVRDGEEG
jgi:hypothetical protein